MEANLNKLTLIELRKRYKITGRYRMKKAELIQKILEQPKDVSHVEQQKDIPNYDAFKNVFKKLPITTLIQYYDEPPFPYFKTLAAEELNVRICFTKVGKNQYKQMSENFIRDFQHKVDWNNVSAYTILSESFIREFKHRVYWSYISSHQSLSEGFIREFQDIIGWWGISYHQNISASFIREFRDKIHWWSLSNNRKVSEDVFREFQDEIDWHTLITHQYLSEEFIREFRRKFKFSDIINNQIHLSLEFLEEMRKPYLPFETDEDCCICLDTTENMVKTIACNHICCRTCMDRLLIEFNHPKCPLCRTVLN